MRLGRRPRARTLAVLALVPAAFLAPLAPGAAAQGATPADTAPPPPPPLTAPIPTDSSVIVGQLPNGLRYYVRANHRPEHRAELRLVVNAGSILEDSAQRGLAHFVEHMAFNGTTHFARSSLVSYLESTGVRFGADLNASTGFDETVYQLQVPTDSAKLLATGIEILADWAHGVTFDSTELDRERGVVIEEWRLGRGARQRIFDKQLPVIFAGSRYAERVPIGDPHTIQTAPRSELVRFYDQWYRPDLMAVVAVGDFDPARVEQLIREQFARIPEPPHPTPRPVYPVPDRTQTAVTVTTDPEATQSSVSLYVLQPVREQRTIRDYRAHLVETLHDAMLNDRFSEMARRPDAPFLGAYSAEGSLVRSKEAYLLSAVVKDGGVARGLGALLTEAARVVQHGFTATELERTKRAFLRGMEQAYAERDKRSSSAFVGDYVGNFLEGDPIPSIAQEYALTRALLPGVTVDEVDRVAKERLAGTGRVIAVTAPAKDSASLPSEAALLALADSATHATVAAYVDSTTDGPLVAHPPRRGRVVAERRIPEIGVTEWTLSNGAHVILKPTDFKADQLLVRAVSPGGTSLAPDSALVPAQTADGVVSAGGVGAFSAVALEKALAGRAVSVGPSIGTYDEGISGAASPKDADALFQLMYLYFTAPRADSAAFVAYQDMLRSSVANRSASPEAAFQDTLSVTLAQHHPRARPLTSAVFNQMSLARSLAFYRDRFADASDFTFYIVGNIDATRIKPLVEQYLAALPATHRDERWRDVGLDYPRGVVRRVVRKGTEPRSETQIVFTGPLEFTRHNVYVLSSLVDLLRMRLRDRLREQLSGTYGVSVFAAPSHYPRQRYQLGIGFSSAPQRSAELVRALFAELDSIATYGPTAADLQKIKEMQLRERETNLRQNSFWLSILYSYRYNGWDLRDIRNYDADVKQLDAATLREAARRYLDRKNYVQVSLVPDEHS
jgi:zinc protease